jgi:hypothetical protein
MIPSVRSMIVAMVLAVVALSCGFGVFAAFRVNHEPLARLPATATPFQYVADNAAPPAVTFAAGQSFGSRFQLSEAMIAGAAAGITRTPDSTDGGPPSAADTVTPAADSTEPAPPAAASTESQTAAIESPNDQASAAAPATEAPKPETAAPVATAPAEPPEQSSAKATIRHRQAAKPHRARRARATAIAQSANPNATFPAPNSKTTPPAVGGPFVSPPAR